MSGNKEGTDDITDTEIYNSFMVAPQDMTMQMYMLGVMYAPSDNLTLMLMQNYIQKDMDLRARMMMNGMVMFREFSTSSTDIGDVQLSALYGLLSTEKRSFHLNAGINIPIGETEARDDTPMMQNMKLPYAMQLGSGTWDFTIGGTYKETYTSTSWGSQLLGTFRTGTNSESYRFGNLYQLNLWGAYNVFESVSISGRFHGVISDDITGMDPDLNPMMVTTASPMNYGGTVLRALVGTNISFPANSSFRHLRLGIEAGLPFFEDYNGIQMDEDFLVNFGIKYQLL